MIILTQEKVDRYISFLLAFDGLDQVHDAEIIRVRCTQSGMEAHELNELIEIFEYFEYFESGVKARPGQDLEIQDPEELSNILLSYLTPERFIAFDLPMQLERKFRHELHIAENRSEYLLQEGSQKILMRFISNMDQALQWIDEPTGALLETPIVCRILELEIINLLTLKRCFQVNLHSETLGRLLSADVIASKITALILTFPQLNDLLSGLPAQRQEAILKSAVLAEILPKLIVQCPEGSLSYHMDKLAGMISGSAEKIMQDIVRKRNHDQPNLFSQPEGIEKLCSLINNGADLAQFSMNFFLDDLRRFICLSEENLRGKLVMIGSSHQELARLMGGLKKEEDKDFLIMYVNLWITTINRVVETQQEPVHLMSDTMKDSLYHFMCQPHQQKSLREYFSLFWNMIDPSDSARGARSKFSFFFMTMSDERAIVPQALFRALVNACFHMQSLIPFFTYADQLQLHTLLNERPMAVKQAGMEPLFKLVTAWSLENLKRYGHWSVMPTEQKNSYCFARLACLRGKWMKTESIKHEIQDLEAELSASDAILFTQLQSRLEEAMKVPGIPHIVNAAAAVDDLASTFDSDAEFVSAEDGAAAAAADNSLADDEEFGQAVPVTTVSSEGNPSSSTPFLNLSARSSVHQAIVVSPEERRTATAFARARASELAAAAEEFLDADL